MDVCEFSPSETNVPSSSSATLNQMPDQMGQRNKIDKRRSIIIPCASYIATNHLIYGVAQSITHVNTELLYFLLHCCPHISPVLLLHGSSFNRTCLCNESTSQFCNNCGEIVAGNSKSIDLNRYRL